MTTILTIIITLGILVVFHELGHFLAAKSLGVGVKIFSLGFGPKLLACTFGETEYRLSLVPFGGYVSFYEPVSKNTGASSIVRRLQKDRSFDNASVFLRTLIVAAGPAWNFLLSILICWGLFWVNGITGIAPTVDYVEPNSAAERAGILVGDTIIRLDGPNGLSIEQPYWEDVVKTVHTSLDETLHFVILREGQEIAMDIVPTRRFDMKKGGLLEPFGHVGLAPTGEKKRVAISFAEAGLRGVAFTWEITAETAKAFGLLVTGYLPSDAIGGPIMISQAISEHAERGLATLFALIAIISVNLGLVNLLPLPVLDGGHIVMFMVEAVRGRPVSEAMQKNFQRVGLVFLLLLMAWGTYNDIMRVW